MMRDETKEKETELEQFYHRRRIAARRLQLNDKELNLRLEQGYTQPDKPSILQPKV